MRQSLYLILATSLIKADIHQQQRKIRKQLRPERFEHQYFNAYLLKDIGLQPDGFAVGEKVPPIIKAKRTVRHLRHLYYGKISS